MTDRMVIYHGNCFDGFTAAWICQRFTEEWHGAEFYPAKYGETIPDCSDRHVLIVDFSYPRDELLDLNGVCASLRVLDHHKTAEADLEGLPFCTFDMERSGAGLAWDELVGGPRPWLVDAIEDRDLWRLRIPSTQRILAYVATQPHEFANWDHMLNAMGENEVVRAGAYIREYIDQYGRLARAEARRERVGGIEMLTINAPYMNCSDHINGLLDVTVAGGGGMVAASYFRRADGRWQFSLRSLAPFDCSEIAKQYGGGGHAQAAGFDVAELPWSSDIQSAPSP